MVLDADCYRQQVEALAEERLRPYLDRLRTEPPEPRPKDINDAVWHTITLRPFEVIILDSPLLQRLRGIRQLGVAHWTYPSAVHSRLEHSLGALHMAHRLYECLSAGTAPAPGPAWLNLLRLAALCHDFGHGFMSHVSENALDAIGVVEDLKLELADKFERESVAIAEVASSFMLGSPAFRELIKVAKEATHHELPPDYEALLPKLVLGLGVCDRYPLLHEIISGPFDADKLDYMTRDATMSGLPVVTDIPRLVNKVRLVEVPQHSLPQRIAKNVGVENIYYLQGIAMSGARTLDELMIGRTLLFDKIYRHQKIRATEAMVAAILSTFIHEVGDRAAILPLLLRDHDVLHLEVQSIEKKLKTEFSGPTRARVALAADLSRRLRERRLFVAAYCYSHFLPGDPFLGQADQETGLERLRREAEKPEGRQLLAHRIGDELRRMRQVLPGQVAPHLGDDALDLHFALDPPALPGRTSEIAKAFLTTRDGRVMPFREDYSESSPWSNAYRLTRDLGFVFSARELAPAVFLACETVLLRDFGVRTPPNAFEYVKANRAVVERLRMQLAGKGFYPASLSGLRPKPARLSRADVRPKVDSIVARLARFDTVVTQDGQKRTAQVTADLVTTWVSQFERDEWCEAALDLLGGIKVLDRLDLHQAVEGFMRAHPEFRGAQVCPLGSPRDSSVLMTYYVGDLATEYDLTVRDLRAALDGHEALPLLFVDDFVGRGSQVETILCEWFDRKDEAPLDEEHGGPLTLPQRERLLKRRVGFLFVSGSRDGIDALHRATERIGLKEAVGHVALQTTALPRAFDGEHLPANSPARHPAFEQRCREIGSQVLSRYGGKEREQAWRADRELGYGNHGLLLAFPYNVPTQTLTLLWCGGRGDDWAWLPLLPRRQKE